MSTFISAATLDPDEVRSILLNKINEEREKKYK